MNPQIKWMLKVYWALFLYTITLLYVIVRAMIGYEVYLLKDEMFIVFIVTITVFTYTAWMKSTNPRDYE